MKFKNNWKLIVFALLLVIGVGYAALSETLKIAGTSGVKSNKWIIYFDKIQNESGVVSTNTKITDDKQEVDFNITLNKPGDYYEFDVDTVNDGTIDAMIDSAEFGELDDSVKDLVTFDVTYKDGSKIKKCDTLPKESRKTITIKVKYKDDIKEQDLLIEDKSLNLTFTINYVQDSVCESYPAVIVDPNGGTYNGSNKLTKIKTDKNSDNLLDAPIREGYEFLYFKTESGTALEKDENGKTNVHVEEDDIKVIAVWKEDNTPRYTVTIDPDGGTYKGQTGLTTTYQNEGDVVTLEDPIRENYIFDGWEEITETNSLSSNGVTVPAANVTIKAIWKTEADYVARINTKYYTTIQKAFDAAVEGDKVWLLKSTTENGNNTKNISFDLGGFTVTGTITNSGTLTIDNGRISNTESSPFVNTGTVNVGTKDGNMIADSIVIFGGENVNGLTQNGTFNFYDGYIEGKLAVTGGYNELEEGYYYIVDHDDDNNCQKAYLSPDIDAIVMIKINNNPIYFKLLQDAIDMTTNDNPNIYAIKNFETSKAVVITSDQKVIFDICGYTILEGAQITNNGEFTIVDTKEEKGEFSPSLPIVNNNKLNITNAALTQSTTAGNLIENSGDLNITNSTLKANNGYALDIKTGGNLVFDETTTIQSNSFGIYNEAQEDVTITGGNVVGIDNEGTHLTINNTNLSDSTSTRSILNESGKIELNNVNVDAINSTSIGLSGTSIINGGTYSTTRYDLLSNSGTLTIKDATFKSTYSTQYSSNDDYFISNNYGTLTIENTKIDTASSIGIFNSRSSTLNVKSSNITSTGQIAIKNNKGDLWGSSRSDVIITDSVITSNSREAISCADYAYTTINNSTVTSNGSYAIYNGENLTINSGTIISTTSYGIYNSGSTTTILGGTIKGKNYGIYITEGNVTLGSNNGNVSTTIPSVLGELYGIYLNGGRLNFYDGVLYGKTDALYGEVTKMPDRYTITEETEEIDNASYNKKYLVQLNNFIQVGENKFNSLQDAIDFIDTEGTMTLIESSKIVETATIPENKNITFNLNGNTLTNSEIINNKGTFTIKDEDSNNTGTLVGVGNYIIQNEGTLTIKNGNYEGNTIVSQRDKSLTTIENGIFNANSVVSCSGSSGKIASLIIKDGEFNSKSNSSLIYADNYAYVTIEGGTFTSDSTYDTSTTVLLDCPATITGGTFIANKGIALKTTLTTTISNAVVTSNSNYAYYSDGSATIKSMTATSNSSPAAYVRSWTTIEGGTFKSNSSYALYAYGNGINITGGEFIGKTYGANINSGNGTITIGTDDDDVLTTKPVFVGEQYGIYFSDTGSKFYDGIMKGKQAAYYSTPTILPDEYYIKDDTEVIEGETYQTAYLVKSEDFLQVGDKTFASLKKAVDYIEEEGTITLIDDGLFTNEVTIPEGKNITLDLNSHTLNQSQSIINNGTLNIDDSSDDKTGTISLFTSVYGINNKGTLNYKNGTYLARVNLYSNGAVITGTTATSNITVTGGTIKLNDNCSGSAISLRNGTLDIKDGNILSSDGNATIDITYATNVLIEGGTINNSYKNSTAATGLYVHPSSSSTSNKVPITITNCNISGYTGVNLYNSEFTMSNGTITGTGSHALNLSGYTYTTITGGTLFSETGNGINYQGSTLTIGSNEGNIDITSPTIEGKLYGIYNPYSGTVKFYDGILKGQTAAYYKTIDEFATDAIIYDDTETDENEIVKQTAYLIKKTNIIRNKETSEEYKDLSVAVNEASENDTLELIDDATIFEETTIPNKTLTLDLAGYSMTINKKITNEANLTITDSSQDNTSKILHNSQYINALENNNVITLSKVKINNTSGYYTIINNKDLNVDNSSFIGYPSYIQSKTNSNTGITNTTINPTINNSGYSVRNEGGSLTLNNSTYMTTQYYPNLVYSYEGSLNINGGTYSSGGISNNSGIMNVDGGTYSKTAFYNNNSDNTKTSTIKNISTDSITSGYEINNNYGTLEVSNSTISGWINNTDGTLTIDNITQSASVSKDSESSITNTGTLDIKDSSSTITGYGIGINNSGTLELNGYDLSLSGSGYYSNSKGISNTGTIKYNKANINVEDTGGTYAGTTYGINNNNGTITILEGSINVIGTNSYGIYQTKGQVTLGEDESPANVSTTNPKVTAVGTTSGIGVKKLDGTFNYYDGIITGSLEAKPEAPTDIPTRYRVIFDTDTNGYQNCILEYVP